MRNKLWIFGDSFSETFNTEEILKWKKNYINFKGYAPKVFGDIVAEKLDLELENTNLKGNPSDNTTILSRIITNIDNIKDGDVISIGWTSFERFRIANTKTNKWVITNPNQIGPLYDISEQTINEISVNRSDVLFYYELCEWTDMINKLFKNNRVIQWTWTQHSVMKCQTITQETNGLLQDSHWSERGHEEFAQFFLDCYNNINCINFFKKKNINEHIRQIS